MSESESESEVDFISESSGYDNSDMSECVVNVFNSSHLEPVSNEFLFNSAGSQVPVDTKYDIVRLLDISRINSQ